MRQQDVINKIFIWNAIWCYVIKIQYIDGANRLEKRLGYEHAR